MRCIEIPTGLNVAENWLINTFKVRKMRYLCYIKRHNGLERMIVEGVAPGKRDGLAEGGLRASRKV